MRKFKKYNVKDNLEIEKLKDAIASGNFLRKGESKRILDYIRDEKGEINWIPKLSSRSRQIIYKISNHNIERIKITVLSKKKDKKDDTDDTGQYNHQRRKMK